MIYFITGPSSCGKTRLFSYLSSKHPDIEFLSADPFYKNIASSLKKEWRLKLDWSGFQQTVQDQGDKEWIHTLNTKGKTELLFVDDIVSNVAGYLHEIQCPFRVFLLGASLSRFYLNLKRRKDRQGGQVLKEITELYEPSPYPTKLSFNRNEFDLFLKLKGYSSKRVRSQLKKTISHFFPEPEKEHTYVRVNLTIPLPIYSFVCAEEPYRFRYFDSLVKKYKCKNNLGKRMGLDKT